MSEIKPNPQSTEELSRRQFLKLTGGVSVASLFPMKALAKLQEFDIVDLNPLLNYPYRDWEDLYRKQFT